MIFLNILDDLLKKCDSGEFLILGGDFNCTELVMDRNHVEPHMPSRRRLIELIKSHDLTDLWRNFNIRQRQYTWAHSHENMLSMARLDRFYTFKHQLSCFRNSYILPVGFSDHSMVLCTFF